MTQILPASDEAIAEAARILKAGGLVAFPTETVYGLGADARDGRAVAKIFAAKGRPRFNPLIVHGDSCAGLEPYAQFDERARHLASRFWPGPLTLILPLRPDSSLSDLVTAGLDTVAVRVPDHPVARALIRAAGMPLAAPSANRSGTLSPTAPHHVAESLGDAVPLILAGGATRYGLESTVLDLTSAAPVIARPGAVSAEEIAEILGCTVTYDTQAKERPISPGQLLRHYAPDLPLRLNAVEVATDEALLGFGSMKFMGIRGGGFARDLPPESFYNLSEQGDLLEAASRLFAGLRTLDRSGKKRIAVMAVPEKGIGIAINDRLRRAAAAHDA